MPAIAAISLAKALDLASAKSTSATLSADRTFLPAGRNADGVVRYESRGEGIPVGFPVITISTRRPTATSKLYKVIAKLHFPSLEVIGVADSGYQAANAKAYEHMATLEFMIPERGTLAQRTEFFSLVASLFLSNIAASDGDPTTPTLSPLKACIVDLDTVYG